MARAVADDPRLRAFTAVAGYYSDTTQFPADAYALARGRTAESHWNDTGTAATILAVSPDNGDVAVPLTEAYEYYGTRRGAVANYTNAFAVQSLAYTSLFDAQSAAPRLTVPFAMIHSEHALAPMLARKFFANVATPKSELWLESTGQIDFYDDPELITPATEFAVDLFRSTLG
ncbi:hypothetical protein [Nocardia sp. NPDC004415]